MKRDIQQIIKAAAERYGLEYNPNSKHVTVLQDDGSIKTLQPEDVSEVFNISLEDQSWSKTFEDIEWVNSGVQINLKEDLSQDYKVSVA